MLSIGSNHPSAVKGLGSSVVGLLPSAVRNAVDKWNNSGGNEFPSMGAWVGRRSFVFTGDSVCFLDVRRFFS